MRFYLILAINLILVQYNYAQKKELNEIDYQSFPTYSGKNICSNGKYIYYGLRTSKQNIDKYFVSDIKNEWKMELPSVNGFKIDFSANSRFIIFINGQDSLGILELGRSEIKYVPRITSFKLSDNSDFLAYQTFEGKLTIVNLVDGRKRFYDGVADYIFDKSGTSIYLKSEEWSFENQSSEILKYVDLNRRTDKIIWRGNIHNLIVSNNGNVAFVDKNNSKTSRLYYYNPKSGGTKLLIDTLLPKDISDFKLSEMQYFSKEDQYLFFTIRPKKEPVVKSDEVGVTVWSYLDPKVKSTLKKNPTKTDFMAYVDIRTGLIRRLENDNEVFSLIGEGANKGIVVNTVGAKGESNWNKYCNFPMQLIFLNDGKRINLPFRVIDPSPSERYFVYFNNEDRNYYCYDIKLNLTKNLTKNIIADWFAIPIADDRQGNRGVLGWSTDENWVYLYDKFDIWKVSLTSPISAKNMTHGYGKLNNIIFKATFSTNSVINENEAIILTAFNPTSKDNGFFKLSINKRNTRLEKLVMDKMIFDPILLNGLPNKSASSPIKAKNADAYLFRIESSIEFPNYYSTLDFRTFVRLSNYQPQKKVNWLTTELISWKNEDGNMQQGILYKPENFDISKKYPMIIHYYEKRSDGLNCFLFPDYSGNGLNIPSYVGKGYLVFVPDLFFKIGETGESALKSVNSGIKSLVTRSYIDTTKIGLQGISFGGFTTNYIVTHSNYFAAACSQSSGSNLTSMYNMLRGENEPNHGIHEVGQLRMGKTLWEAPSQYINNSAVFNAHKVTTPILLFHTSVDGAVDFSQGVQFFNALRRLGKTAWLLEYEYGNHAVYGKPAQDFSLRMEQFFDHYLKGYPAPRWMIETADINADREEMLKLNDEGRSPGPGILNNDEQNKVRTLMKQSVVNVTIN